MKLRAFILAAGLGERLRPITEHIPKPLLPVLGKPVLQSVLEKIFSLSPEKTGVNLHYKKEQIEEWLKHSSFDSHIDIFPEDPILGTGGALKNAEDFLKDSVFIVHNSDIYSDIDLEKLIEFHLSSENIATLAVHNYPEFNKLVIDGEGLLKSIIKHPHPNPPPSRGRESLNIMSIHVGSIAENSHHLNDGSTDENFHHLNSGNIAKNAPYSLNSRSVAQKYPPSPGGRGLGGGGNFLAFTGIAVYNPDFLKFLPAGASSVVHAWDEAISAGWKIGVYDVTGCAWSDIGTPLSYARTVINELRNNGETVYIHPSVDWCSRIEMDGHIVIENISNTHLWQRGARGDFSGITAEQNNIFLRNCIILPGTNILAVSPSFENCILGPGFKIDLNEPEMLGGKVEDNSILIGTGGSDRKYYRIRDKNASSILMQCSKDDPDFRRHIEYTEFFRRYSVPVPDLISSDSDNMRVYFEDLGDVSLYSWLKCPRSLEEIEKIYRKILDILVIIHSTATGHLAECTLLQERVFDYNHLRWETGYFLERFVAGVKNIRVENHAKLEEEFHRLALKVDSFPKTIVHRDFQSQNIMITKEGIPRVIDYQGARIGPPAYDVASILWDPYYRLNDSLRKKLIEYYINKAIPPSPPLQKWGNNKTDTDVNIPLFNKEGLGEIFISNFHNTLLPCRLQRHMQALGAYGYLSIEKGKKYFLKHVPEALRLLKEESAFAKDEYPELFRLVSALYTQRNK